MPPEPEPQSRPASTDAIGALENALVATMSSQPGPQRVIDAATITALVNLFLGLFDACRSRFGTDKALQAAQQPGTRETRIARRLVLRDHFDGDRRAYREGDGDGIAASVLSAAKASKPEAIMAAAAQYREDPSAIRWTASNAPDSRP